MEKQTYHDNLQNNILEKNIRQWTFANARHLQERLLLSKNYCSIVSMDIVLIKPFTKHMVAMAIVASAYEVHGS